MTADFELAPHVVVRVAGWPLSALEALLDPELAVRARADAPGYADAYARSVQTSRRTLWATTVGDGAFVRALTVANPALAEGLDGKPVPATRNKSARHYETTLYRYLARAVGRTEPSGLWTSVTLARWGEQRRTRRIPSAVDVAPDLAPFRAVMLALREREPYLARARFKLNPTLRADAEGAWVFWSEPTTTISTQRRLGGSVALDKIIDALQRRRSWSRAEAMAAMQDATQLPTRHAAAVFEQLRGGSVLVGGLAFPREFSDAWDALEQAEHELDPDDARAWRGARTRLRRIARTLAAELLTADRPTIVKAMDAARAEVDRLCADLDVLDVARPRTPLRCDVAAPWEVVLGELDAAKLRRCVREFSLHQGGDCLHGSLLHAGVRAMLGDRGEAEIATVDPPSRVDAEQGFVTWEALARAHDEPELSARTETLGTLLANGGREQWLVAGTALAGPSVAALHFTLGTSEVADAPIVQGLGLDPTAAYARFAPLLRATGAGALEAWFRRSFAVVAHEHGVDYVALVYDHPTPNVLARPPLWNDTLDPWGVSPGSLATRGARLSLEPDAVGPAICVAGRPRPVIAVAPTAASVRVDDPCLTALLLSSMHLPPLAGAGEAAHACELHELVFGPRLRLPDGTVVHKRRTVLRGDALAQLVAVKGPERFARWQRLAARLGWPTFVWLSRPGRPPMLVGRDSPLAVEAAFEGSRRSRFMIVEEFTSAAWVGGEDVEHRYVAQLVLPFVRKTRAHPVRARARAVDPAQRRPGRALGLAPSR